MIFDTNYTNTLCSREIARRDCLIWLSDLPKSGNGVRVGNLSAAQGTSQSRINGSNVRTAGWKKHAKVRYSGRSARWPNPHDDPIDDSLLSALLRELLISCSTTIPSSRIGGSRRR